MWVIGIVVCAALMLGGHAVMNTGHGSHSHEQPDEAAQPAQTAAERDGAAVEGAPEDAAQPESGSHH